MDIVEPDSYGMGVWKFEVESSDQFGYSLASFLTKNTDLSVVALSSGNATTDGTTLEYWIICKKSGGMDCC